MPNSLPALLRDRESSRLAIRRRSRFGWDDYSYAGYWRGARSLASALVRDGVEPGDRVGLLAPNSFEWLVADLAIQAAGAVTVPLHLALPPAHIADQLDAVGATRCFTTPPLRAKLPHRIEALRLELAPFPIDFDVKEVERRIDALTRESLSTILFTSGTTGSPKGVQLTHGNLLSNAEAAQKVLPWGTDGLMLNFLPFSHVYARTSDAFQSLVAGATLALAESPDTVPRDLLEVRPDFVRGVPRFYEKMLSVAGEPSRLPELFGGRTRWLFVGGAGLPDRIAAAYRDAGLTLLQGYGLTETSPTITVNRPDAYRIGTVGVPLPGYEIRIADDGEILTRGPHVMAGYWRDDDATSAVLRDGWFHTGDTGIIDESDFLSVIGRKKELIVLSTGRKVVPSLVEKRLQAEPSVEHAVVCGDGRPYLVALIAPRGELGNLSAATEELAPWERVTRFAVLSDGLSVERGELTVSQKVRRDVVLARYAGLIESLYD